MTHEEPTPQRINPYEMIGGEVGVRRLVDRFYAIMDSDPAVATIRAMHASDLGPMRQSLFEFMSGWLGGPRLYSGCVMSSHGKFAIGPAERDHWMSCMRRAMADVGISDQLQKLLDEPLRALADAVRTR